MSNDRPILDVEDDDQRQNRISNLLEQLNTASPPSSASPNPLHNIGRERVPGPVNPPTTLLARIKSFLPAISASNEALSREKREDIDIENVHEDEEQYIEMNLGLGVFEARPRPKPGSRPASPFSEAELKSTSDAISSESESDSESSLSTSSEDSDFSSTSANDDSDSESCAASPVDMRPISSRPIKPLPRAKIAL